MEKGNNKAVAAVVALVVGGVVGGVAGYAIADNMNDDSDNSSMSMSEDKPNANTKAADLRANLVQLGDEHVQLANIALDGAMDGSPYAGAAKNALVKNGEELSAAIGSVYGDDAQAKFQDLWNQHLGFFVDYAVAAKGKDDAGMKKAKSDLLNYSDEIGTFLSGANPNLPKDVVKKNFVTHLNQIIDMIDAHVAGNYKKEFSVRAEAVRHITGVETVLAGAIVKQFPDKF